MSKIQITNSNLSVPFPLVEYSSSGKPEIHGEPDLCTLDLELTFPHSIDHRSIEKIDFDDIFLDPIVKCQYCKQWGARKTHCKYCGGPIE